MGHFETLQARRLAHGVWYHRKRGSGGLCIMRRAYKRTKTGPQVTVEGTRSDSWPRALFLLAVYIGLGVAWSMYPW